MTEKTRCQWSEISDKMIHYHDTYWGTPLHDDRELFAKLVMDLNQAGLNWRMILDKQEGFYSAFDNFDIKKVAAYGEKDFLRLKSDPSIIRNTLKINAAIVNAQKVLEVQEEFGSFNAYIWSFTKGKSENHHIRKENEIPASNALSDRLSKDMKKRGFKFTGTTVIYAYLQAIGVVNDHIESCFRYKELAKSKEK